MGEAADDLINEWIGRESDNCVQHEYEVRIVDRKTMITDWCGFVTASSKKGAQRQFRKQYSDIRSQYSPADYGLIITRLLDDEST